MLKFSKEKVITAIIKAGNETKITKDIIDELDNYDGQEARKSDWDALVYDKELYIVKGKDGKTTKVEKDFLINDNNTKNHCN